MLVCAVKVETSVAARNDYTKTKLHMTTQESIQKSFGYYECSNLSHISFILLNSFLYFSLAEVLSVRCHCIFATKNGL